MSFHQNEGPPCRNMENLLQQVADGSAKGWRRWYAVAHASQCNHCGTFLQRLRVSLNVLRESRKADVPDEAVARLRSRIEQLRGSNGA